MKHCCKLALSFKNWEKIKFKPGIELKATECISTLTVTHSKSVCKLYVCKAYLREVAVQEGHVHAGVLVFPKCPYG